MAAGRRIAHCARSGRFQILWTNFWFCALIAVCSVGLTQPVWAEPAGLLSYELGISENAMLAKDTHNMMVAQMAAWHTQDDLTAGRSKPNIYLTNTSAEAVISQIVLSVGDLANRIAEIHVLEAHRKLTYQADFTPAHDKVVVTFNSKFKPGRSVLLQLTLKPDDPNVFQYPNYQTVMFDVNGNFAADNSKLKVTFQDLKSGDSLTLAKRFPDYQVPGYIPPTNPFIDGYFEDRQVLAFELFDQKVPAPQVVPEPGSLLLALVGGALACAGWWRKKALSYQPFKPYGL